MLIWWLLVFYFTRRSLAVIIQVHLYRDVCIGYNIIAHVFGLKNAQSASLRNW